MNPSLVPTYDPSTHPSILLSPFPSVYPSSSPTIFHDESSKPSIPTNSPSSPTITSFFVTGDRVKEANMNMSFATKIANLRPKEGEFLVHLGDFNNLRDGCDETSYVEFTSHIIKSRVPVFVTPGDNEWNDCKSPEKAEFFWKKYLSNIEQYWSHPMFKVNRQEPNYEENFSFRLRSVLYIGLNMVGGPVLDEQAWSERIDSNLIWIRTQLALHNDDDDDYDDRISSKINSKRRQVKALVVFGHGNRKPEYKSFFASLAQIVGASGIPTVYIHETNQASKVTTNAMGREHFWIVRVEGGKNPFMKVTVNTDNSTSPFILDGL